MTFLGLDAFYEQAKNGTLPAVSYIVGPMELSEHPPYSPHDGAWLQKQVVNAVTSSPKYNSTALLISYDETGGWGDHVVPYHSPENTAVEWIPDPYIDSHDPTYMGPGFRLPFYIVSPYTRGGAVFTEPSDHNSQLLFVEKWLAAKGTSLTTPELTPWRRAHMSDLTNAFDFENPDYSIPDIPDTPAPHKNDKGEWDGSVYCEAQHANTTPPIPYKESSVGDDAAIKSEAAKLSQKGFKKARGRLTEGRYLTFETGGFALSNAGNASSSLEASEAVGGHDKAGQLWVLHQDDAGLNWFAVNSKADGRWLDEDLSLVDDEAKAANVTIEYGGPTGYTLNIGGKNLGIADGKVSTDVGSSFEVFSVT